MRVIRPLSIFVAVVLLVVTAAPASAATPGVGSTSGTLSVVDLDVGELLTLDVLHDFAAANTDTDSAPAAAAAAINALTVAAPALGVSDTVGLLEAESTGEEDTASNGAAPVSNPVVDGDLLPASVSALLGEQGAAAGVLAGVADLDVLGGVAALDSTELNLGANALTEQADGSRRLLLDNLTALDLGELLAGLGIPVADLPLETLLDLLVLDELGLVDQVEILLSSLGLPIDDLSVEGILGTLDGLLTLAGLDADAICDPLNALLLGVTEGVLDSIAPDLIPGGELCALSDEDITAALAAVPSVEDVVALLTGLLSETALLELTALDVGVLTTATDSLDTSLAEVTATLGGISVAGIELPEVDVLTAVQQITDAVNGLLTTIDPALGDLELIDVGLLEEATDVVEGDEAITSTAQFTALRLDVAGISDELLGEVLGALAIGDPAGLDDSIGGLLGEDAPAAAITSLLGEGDPVTALADGLALRVGSIGQVSTFTEVLSSTATPTPAPTPAPELPATGSNDSLAIVLGAVAAAGALGIRRVLRTKS